MRFSSLYRRLPALWLAIPIAAGLSLAAAPLPAQSYRIVNSASPAQAAPAHSAAPRLPDPTPARIAIIQQTFIAKEKYIRQLLRHSYTYKESIDLDELDTDGNVVGSYKQKNDILFNDSGVRNIVCTWCPQPTLRQVGVSEQDIHDFFDMDAYNLNISQIAEYNIHYIGHFKLDQLTAYEFAITPKQIKKGRHYFQGHVWVDDVSMQIVKATGQDVPNVYDKHGHPTNVFLPFVTYYQPVDNRYWFPVFTESKGTLPYGAGVPVQLVIRYRDYKRYVATHTITPLPGPVPQP